MPVPSLPLDIVFEIVSHFKEEEQTADKIKLHEVEGKSLSLVCKAWKVVGQALRWTSVDVAAAQLPPLVKHFTLYPHLASHVQFFRVDGEGLSAGTTTVGFSEHSFEALLEFLPTLVNLQCFSIRGEMETRLPQILRASSRLERLEEMGLFELSTFDCSNDFISSFQAGFDKLRSLTFFALSTAPSTTPPTSSSSGSKKLSLECLKLSWTSPSLHDAQLADAFLSMVDPTSLSTVILDYVDRNSGLRCRVYNFNRVAFDLPEPT
ncbi:hypothetical protein JCM5350_007311 [Sporobolomyces pararoseus]